MEEAHSSRTSKTTGLWRRDSEGLGAGARKRRERHHRIPEEAMAGRGPVPDQIPTTRDPRASPESGSWPWGRYEAPPRAERVRTGGRCRAQPGPRADQSDPGEPAPGRSDRPCPPRHYSRPQQEPAKPERRAQTAPESLRLHDGLLAPNGAAPPPTALVRPRGGRRLRDGPPPFSHTPRPSGLRLQNRGAEWPPRGRAGRLPIPPVALLCARGRHPRAVSVPPVFRRSGRRDGCRLGHPGNGTLLCRAAHQSEGTVVL